MERKCNKCNISPDVRDVFCYNIPSNIGDDFVCSYIGERKILDKTIELLDSTICFLQDNDLSSLFESFYAYAYMYQSSCFSLCDFKYETYIKEYNDMFFLNVFDGTGCCRHISDLYRILLSRLNKEYNPLFIRGYGSAISNDFNPRRNNTIRDYIAGINSYLTTIFSSRTNPYSAFNYGNHCTVHAYLNGEVFLLDPLNLYAYSFDEVHEYANIINGRGKFYITGAIIGGRNDLSSCDVLKYLKNETYMHSLHDKELEEVFRKVVNTFDKHSDLLSDFRYANEDLVLELTELKEERLSLHI